MVGATYANVRSARIRKIVLDKRTDSRPALIIRLCARYYRGYASSVVAVNLAAQN